MDLNPSLRTDWAMLATRPDAVAAARSWHVTHVPFENLDQLLVLAGYGARRRPDTEIVLRRLVLRSRSEPLAARIVLQRLVPGLLARVRARSRVEGPAGLFEELVSGAWIAICEFDPRRQPACLAAALISSAEHLAFVREDRRRKRFEPHDPHTLDQPVESVPLSACEELAALIAEGRRAGVTDDELAVVRGLIRVGTPSGLATALDVTPRTIRNRRDKVTDRLRRVALAA